MNRHNKLKSQIQKTKRWLPEAVGDGEICKIGQGDGEVQKKKDKYINETREDRIRFTHIWTVCF